MSNASNRPEARISFSTSNNSLSVLIQERLANIFSNQFQISRQVIERCMLDENIKKEVDSFSNLLVNRADFPFLKPLIFSINKSKYETKQFIKCDFVVSGDVETDNNELNIKFLIVHAQAQNGSDMSANDLVNSLLFSEINLTNPHIFLRSMKYTITNIHERLAVDTQNNYVQPNNSKNSSDISIKLNELNVIWNIISLLIIDVENVDNNVGNCNATDNRKQSIEEQITLWCKRVNDYLDKYVKYSNSIFFKYFNPKTKKIDKGPGLELMQWKIVVTARI